MPLTPTQPASVSLVSVGWGTQSAVLETASDGLRLLPAGRSTDLPWLGIDELAITLNQAATLTAPEVSVAGIRGIHYGPVTISGSGTSYTITLARHRERPTEGHDHDRNARNHHVHPPARRLAGRRQ